MIYVSLEYWVHWLAEVPLTGCVSSPAEGTGHVVHHDIGHI
jgi:hypothetical protein